MKMVTPKSAREFLNAARLPLPTREGFERAGEIIGLNAQKDQAMVVASDIVSFMKDVSIEQREDFVNSSLLAQLVASEKVPDKTDIIEWYEAYFDVLENIGWVSQDRGFSSYTEEPDGLETHEAILKFAEVFLGHSPAALKNVVLTLEALTSMDSSKPWMTIFDRESKHAKTGHFQIALAERGDNDQFLVSLMAFSLKAEATMTQVLFFKIRTGEVELEKYFGKVAHNNEVLSSIRDPLKQKIAAYTNDYIAKLPDLG